MTWKLIDSKGRNICIGDWVRTLSGELMVLRTDAMTFSLTFDTENDAFATGREYEISRILREVAARVIRGELNGTIRDKNGNRVGHFNGVTE